MLPAFALHISILLGGVGSSISHHSPSHPGSTTSSWFRFMEHDHRVQEAAGAEGADSSHPRLTCSHTSSASCLASPIIAVHEYVL